MKITKKHIKKAEFEVVVDILCNRCNDSCKVTEDFDEYEGLIESTICFGYNSKYFGDMTEITFSLCEKCLFEITQDWKIPPEIK